MPVHHEVFSTFSRVTCSGTGRHVFDFLGTATDAQFRSGWDRFVIREGVTHTAALPVVNEHYFDWVAVLNAVRRSGTVFRMAELGAGFGPWLVRGAFAARQLPRIERLELLGVEADATHYRWLREHFAANGLRPDDHRLLNAAASADGRPVRFPFVDEPSSNYGAAIDRAGKSEQYVEIPSISLEGVIAYFSGPLDILHIDIQGAEYDLLLPGFDLLRKHVRSIVIGTHTSDTLHEQLADAFRSQNWTSEALYERQRMAATKYGDVKFGDGFQCWRNPWLSE